MEYVAAHRILIQLLLLFRLTVPDKKSKDPKYDLPSDLLTRLSEEQREGFVNVWGTLARHLRDVCFDRQGERWTPLPVSAYCTCPTPSEYRWATQNDTGPLTRNALVRK